jgi:hypothetical protein
MINFTMSSDFTPLEKYGLIYLATPYTKYVWGIEHACHDAAKIAGRLISRNLSIFSPIVHSHTICMAAGLQALDHEMWMNIDRKFMAKSDALIMCQMPGWQESYGMSLELDYFTKAGLPIFNLDPGFMG